MEDWANGLDFIAAGNYIAVNRSLVKAFGLEAAVMVGELASEAMYWQERGKLADGWFYSTIENVENATGLSGYQQRKALAALVDAGCVEVTQRGLPKKRYIRINFASIMRAVNDKSCSNLTTVGEETAPLEGEKVNVNNHKDTTTTTTTNKGGKTRTRFVPPTVEEVAAYCQQRGNGIDAQHFIDYYAARGWMYKGGTKMKDWKAAVRTWERNNGGTDAKPQQQGGFDASRYNYG